MQEQAQQQGYDYDPQPSQQQRKTSPQELMVPDSDTRALAAYLRLLTRVVGRGNPQRVGAWLGQWEAGCGVAPLWELLLQLMCYPVPQVGLGVSAVKGLCDSRSQQQVLGSQRSVYCFR